MIFIKLYVKKTSSNFELFCCTHFRTNALLKCVNMSSLLSPEFQTLEMATDNYSTLS